jgi:hypothetical protein
MPGPVRNRAEEEWQKRDVMEKLLTMWLNNPQLRLGQLLVGAVPASTYDLFFTEDYDLVDMVAKYNEFIYKGKK